MRGVLFIQSLQGWELGVNVPMSCHERRLLESSKRLGEDVISYDAPSPLRASRMASTSHVRSELGAHATHVKVSIVNAIDTGTLKLVITIASPVLLDPSNDAGWELGGRGTSRCGGSR
jgi:hypothetical protein